MSAELDVETDLCIVGAGPAGISIARQFAGSGVRVCLLDGGGEDADPHTAKEYRGQSHGYPIHRPHTSRIQAFGGTLRHPELHGDTMAIRPLDPIDFDPRPGIPHTGWPFSRAHLDPYYARAQGVFGPAEFKYHPDDWSDPSRTPVLPVGGDEVVTGVFQRVDPPFGDGDLLREFQRSPNVRVLLNSRVVGIAMHPHRARVDTLMVRRRDGSRLVVRPRAVVLAAGGIENARLLLCGDDMRGIGNEHDLVGRFFAERLYTYAGHVDAAGPGLVDDAAFYQLHHVDNAEVQGVLRVADDAQRERHLLNCAFFLEPQPESIRSGGVRSLSVLRKALARRPLPEDTRAHLVQMARDLRGISRFAMSRGGDTRQLLVVRAQAEQAPNPDSRVTLGTSRDGFGLPVAGIKWVLEDSDRESIKDSLDVVGESLRLGGLGSVDNALGEGPPRQLMEGLHHHMGTTRMHVDPRCGVVDAECRVHSLANLYVAGCSVFPTYGASNPTLTIVALALRLADHLAGLFGLPHSRCAGPVVSR